MTLLADGKVYLGSSGSSRSTSSFLSPTGTD